MTASSEARSCSSSRVRARTYEDYAWPPALGSLYRRNGLAVSLALAAGLALFLVLAVALNGSLWHEPLAGDFYRVFAKTSHGFTISSAQVRGGLAAQPTASPRQPAGLGCFRDDVGGYRRCCPRACDSLPCGFETCGDRGFWETTR